MVWFGLQLQFKKFNKYIKIGKHDEQISATQTNHRPGLGAKTTAVRGYGSLGAKPPVAGEFL